MSANSDGILVPRRAIYILIFVSLFINVFFLLMGILIGKDDLKWNKQPAVNVAENRPDPVEKLEDSLENELLAFEKESSENRRKPIDPSYLNEDTPVKTVPREPRVSEQTQPQQVQKAKPEPTPTRKATPPPARSEVAQPSSKPSPGIWIQVLAIKDRAQAEKFRRKVADGGFRTMIVTVGGLHKVRVGPYPDRSSANRDKKRIFEKYKADGWIVTPN